MRAPEPRNLDLKAAPRDARISFWTKVFYGLGSIAFGVKDNGFRFFLLLYYNQVIGLAAAKVAFAIMIAMIADALVDPVIGEISDNWRSRWGRRHPLMYAAAIPSALSFLLVWFPPHWGQNALLIYLIVTAILVRACITIYEIPSTAMAAELSTDYDQRTSLMSYRWFFFFIGGTTLTIITYRVFLQPDRLHSIGLLNPEGFHKYAITASLVIFLAIALSALGTHRLIPTLRRPPTHPPRSPIKILVQMGQTVSNRHFLMVAGAGLCKSMTLGISGSLAIYMNTYFWQLKSSQIATLTFDGFFTAGLAFWLTPILGKRFDKRNLCLIFYAGSFLIAIWPTPIHVLGLGLSVGSPTLLPVLFLNNVLYGAMGISATILASSMIADVVEDSERSTGRRSEGLLFAANSLIGKAVSGVGIFGSGMILSLVHFPEKARPGQVDSHIVNNMALAYIPVAALLYTAGVVLMLNYRIDRKRHLENLTVLKETPVEQLGSPTSP